MPVKDMNSYMKEWQQTCKDAWGEFDLEYYQLLFCNDNLKNIIYSKYKSIKECARALGYSEYGLSNRFTQCEPPNMKGLRRLCKGLNVSFEYAIFGGHEEPYTVENITYNNLRKIYKEKYSGHKLHILSSLLYQTKTGHTKSIPLKYLIRIAREQNVTIDWLVGG